MTIDTLGPPHLLGFTTYMHAAQLLSWQFFARRLSLVELKAHSTAAGPNGPCKSAPLPPRQLSTKD